MTFVTNSVLRNYVLRNTYNFIRRKGSMQDTNTYNTRH